jgi:DNA topoisomerase IA
MLETLASQYNRPWHEAVLDMQCHGVLQADAIVTSADGNRLRGTPDDNLDQAAAVHLAERLRAAQEATIHQLIRSISTEAPPPPYTTALLQQDAARVGMSVKQTMRVAQQLFEGTGARWLPEYLWPSVMQVQREAVCPRQ